MIAREEIIMINDLFNEKSINKKEESDVFGLFKEVAENEMLNINGGCGGGPWYVSGESKYYGSR